MSRQGKCHNYAGCLLAYRGERTEVPDGQPFVCAECGKPLTQVKASPAKLIAIVGTILLVAALVIGAFAMWPKIAEMIQKKKTVAAATATPGSSEPSTTPETPDAPPAPNPDKKGDAVPPPQVVMPAKVTLNVDEKVKREVLKRIDLIPAPIVSKVNKDKLYNAVERARKMGILLTVPFDSGRTNVSAKDTAALKEALEKPETMDFRNDPTAVFVVLGFADPKGDPKANLAYSQSRADSVVTAMKRECGVQNIVHAVAMGGSSLLDEKNLEKNRIAEVWVVLP